jgi:hypothetical protein
MTRRILYLIISISLVTTCKNTRQSAISRPPSDSGIEGIVLIGPISPEIQNYSKKSYVPFVATIVVQDHNRTHNLATVHSGYDGTFRVFLSPGNYWLNPISPNPGIPPSATPLQVIVKPHSLTNVKIHYDTGLRKGISPR